MSHVDSQKSPVERYRQFGNQLPDAKKLHEVRVALGRSGRLTLAEAHVYVDLAAVSENPKKSTKWLYSARDATEQFIAAQTSPLSNPQHATLRTEGLLTLASIPMWEAILHNDTERIPPYEQMLAIGAEIAVVSRGSGRAIAKATEFAPVLLGLRSVERGGSDEQSYSSWLGRAALLREDKRATAHLYKVQKAETHNWDVGASLDIKNPRLLQFPPYKIQKKMGHVGAKDDYAEGIAPVVAREIGTSNIRNIIAACTAEYHGEDATPLSSAELDTITADLFRHFQPNASNATPPPRAA
jgi:hypothetical protein